MNKQAEIFEKKANGVLFIRLVKINLNLNNKQRGDYILVKENQTIAAAKKSIQNFIYRQRDNFQDKDRILSKETYNRINELRAEGIKAELSIHGNRHKFAQDRLKESSNIDLNYCCLYIYYTTKTILFLVLYLLD